MTQNTVNRNKKVTQTSCYSLLMVSTLMMFFIAEVIRRLLFSYELSSMFVSFYAGFILFTPLVALVLHPLSFNQNKTDVPFHFSAFVTNLGLVIVVQIVCFLI